MRFLGLRFELPLPVYCASCVSTGAFFGDFVEKFRCGTRSPGVALDFLPALRGRSASTSTLRLAPPTASTPLPALPTPPTHPSSPDFGTAERLGVVVRSVRRRTGRANNAAVLWVAQEVEEENAVDARSGILVRGCLGFVRAFGVGGLGWKDARRRGVGFQRVGDEVY